MSVCLLNPDKRKFSLCGLPVKEAAKVTQDPYKATCSKCVKLFNKLDA